MAALTDDIAAFDHLKAMLESRHRGQWVVFESGQLVGAFDDYEAAATEAVDRFGGGTYLIRQVGAPPIQLSGGMVFTPAHALGQRRL